MYRCRRMFGSWCGVVQVSRQSGKTAGGVLASHGIRVARIMPRQDSDCATAKILPRSDDTWQLQQLMPRLCRYGALINQEPETMSFRANYTGIQPTSRTSLRSETPLVPVALHDILKLLQCRT